MFLGPFHTKLHNILRTIMSRFNTIAEKRWPGPPQEFLLLAKSWSPDVSEKLLGYVWEGLDLLTAEVLASITVTGDEEELERNITEVLEPKIRDVVPPHSPFFIQHAAREMESRAEPPAQAPEYDLAFRLRANFRIMWPIEAKALRTDGRVSEYVKEVRGNFLTCRYAPFSSEAVMLSYLVSGKPNKFFNNITKKLPCSLSVHSKFGSRDHRVSEHSRIVPPGKAYPNVITLHHLVLRIN